MNKGLTLIVFAVCVAITPAFSQKRAKLSKDERILQMAYNDTTKALAALFIEMRNVTRLQSNRALIGAGISSGVVLVGAAIMLSNPDSGVIIASGLIPVFVGIGGVFWFSGAWLISKLVKNPYTLRKFEKLIDISIEGKAIPSYYLVRVKKYLR